MTTSLRQRIEQCERDGGSLCGSCLGVGRVPRDGGQWRADGSPGPHSRICVTCAGTGRFCLHGMAGGVGCDECPPAREAVQVHEQSSLTWVSA